MFIKMPSGNVFSLNRIGGSKATDRHWLLLGSGATEILEYQEASAAVATAWRDALTDLLLQVEPRSGRAARQIGWEAVARAVDPDWADRVYGPVADANNG